MSREKVNYIIDFIVSGIEVAETRDSIKELAAGAVSELRQLLTSSDHHVVQGTKIIKDNGSKGSLDSLDHLSSLYLSLTLWGVYGYFSRVFINRRHYSFPKNNV